MRNTHSTREAWLQAAVALARPDFEDLGSPIPDAVRVGIGMMTGKNHIGECWSLNSSADGHREIWIKPYTVDRLEILGTLVHELAHAALPHEVAHKAPFVKLARALCLEGKPTATTIGDAFKMVWEPRLEELGPYPGGVMKGEFKAKKKRPPSHVHMVCACGVTFHVTPKVLEATSGEFQCIDTSCDSVPVAKEKGDD